MTLRRQEDNVRAILILTAVFSFFGCDRPHFDLTHPIYLVADDSLWEGCESDSRGFMVCENERVQTLYSGIGMWTEHFAASSRPKILLVYPAANVPADAVNEPIRLWKGDTSSCHGPWLACYQWGPFRTTGIVFRHATDLTPDVMAHEFGHAIWMDGHVHDRLSIMAPTVTFYVAPLDVSGMCETNGTCPSHDDTWCEGTFYDQYRCPSSSPEDGDHMARCTQAKLGIGKPVLDCE